MIRYLCLLVWLVAASAVFAQETGYQLHPEGGVVRLSDGARIPENAGNRHWVEYQKWLADGGVPRPAPPAELRKPLWTGLAWEESEPTSDADARTARNAARGRLRADVNDPGLRGGLPALNDKVTDILEILNHMKKLEDE